MVLGGEVELRVRRQNQRLHHRQLVKVSDMGEVSFAPVIRAGTIGTFMEYVHGDSGRGVFGKIVLKILNHI
jgi:hypothetical protein